MFKNIIIDHKINLKNADVLNFLKVRRRWPHSYPWGQPAIEIITNIILGYYVFKDFPDLWTFLGLFIIMSSGIYIFRRETIYK